MSADLLTAGTEVQFEEALEQLKAIVEKLETGNLRLDDAIALFEQGSILKNACQQKLEKAKLQISKIIAQDGKATNLEAM
jgi:exodeoxyribonuclease VII small subunit